MNKDKMLKKYTGFNTEYFKIGQIVKVTVEKVEGELLEKFYGCIELIMLNGIDIVYVNEEGTYKHRTITPEDIIQENININIEVIGENRN